MHAREKNYNWEHPEHHCLPKSENPLLRHNFRLMRVEQQNLLAVKMYHQALRYQNYFLMNFREVVQCYH